MNYDEIIIKAIEFATKAHEGQKHKDGKDYITHPLAVMSIAESLVKASDIQLGSHLGIESIRGKVDGHMFIIRFISAWHDLVEDTIWKNREEEALSVFAKEIGLSSIPLYGEIAHALFLVNKNNHANYFEYIIAIKYNIYARTAKLGDLKHNMSDLEEGSLKDKYRLAEYILNH